MSKEITETLIEILERERAAGVRCVYLSEANAEYLRSGSQASTTASGAGAGPKSRGQAPREHRAPDPPSPPVEQGPPIPQLGWEDLRERVTSCRLCPLHEHRTRTVFGTGDPHADLMFIGEGPGRDEDRQGVPFVGAAGELLTRMIEAMQFSRETVYIANIVKCRPPRNRNPEQKEADACLPYLNRQIELVAPKVIVTLGAVPLRFLLGLNGINRLRGQWQDYQGISVMPTFHPAFLLRANDRKADVWKDLQQVMKRFGKDPRQSVRRTRGGA